MSRNEATASLYRPDVDALRGVAIAAVLLFHAGVPGLAGGFLGVDIFFVISGFLITSIIIRETTDGHFDFQHFYERRVRRIFPALFTVLAVCILPAYVLLPPTELKIFAKSLLSAALFGSNFFFWSQTGYFDGPAEMHPLLHTWSLAIEEQFYLIFPVLFVAGRRRFGARATWLLAGIAGLSLGGYLLLALRNPDAAFYCSPLRIWELLLGALLALRWLPPAPSLSWRQALATGGLALVILSILVPLSPGVAALPACLGAALIIHAGVRRSDMGPLGAVLPAAIWTGQRSYSLYLWHWPMLVFARLYLGRPLAGAEIAVLLVLTFAIAMLSYTTIEQPYRRPDGVFARPGLYGSAAATIVALVSLAGASIIQDGFPRRFTRMLDFGAPEPWKPLCLLNNSQSANVWVGQRCLVNNIAEPVVLLWGDSFAAHYFPAFLARRDALQFNVLLYSLESCAPLLEDGPPQTTCAAFNQAVKAVIERYNIKTVVLAAHWQSKFDAKSAAAPDGGKSPATLRHTVDWLEAQGINVAVIGQTPSFQVSVPQAYWWRMQKGRLVQSDLDADPGHSMNAKLRTVLTATPLLEPARKMCATTTCTIGEGRTPYYGDSRHFTNAGSVRAMAPFWPTLDALVQAAQ
jgi:peptidoglycan/LPS O-acetylase OafA/YrhL